MAITPGIEGTYTVAVGELDTAEVVGSGDVPVLATPRVVAWMEIAAVEALRPLLDESATTVGTEVSIEHLAASPVGTVVQCRAVVTAVEGRTVTFDVSANQEDVVLARGVHRRVVVDRARFLERAGA
ncbi:MAG: thioesterase family protein [Acidimicrobiia bacterium]|nr:thioesterase family protein [Acidimicrobiia bacterium]NNC75861.1 thioesterase family protein [Acidimicrobiia bacterium]